MSAKTKPARRALFTQAQLLKAGVIEAPRELPQLDLRNGSRTSPVPAKRRGDLAAKGGRNGRKVALRKQEW